MEWQPLGKSNISSKTTISSQSNSSDPRSIALSTPQTVLNPSSISKQNPWQQPWQPRLPQSTYQQPTPSYPASFSDPFAHSSQSNHPTISSVLPMSSPPVFREHQSSTNQQQTVSFFPSPSEKPAKFHLERSTHQSFNPQSPLNSSMRSTNSTLYMQGASIPGMWQPLPQDHVGSTYLKDQQLHGLALPSIQQEQLQVTIQQPSLAISTEQKIVDFGKYRPVTESQRSDLVFPNQPKQESLLSLPLLSENEKPQGETLSQNQQVIKRNSEIPYDIPSIRNIYQNATTQKKPEIFTEGIFSSGQSSQNVDITVISEQVIETEPPVAMVSDTPLSVSTSLQNGSSHNDIVPSVNSSTLNENVEEEDEFEAMLREPAPDFCTQHLAFVSSNQGLTILQPPVTPLQQESTVADTNGHRQEPSFVTSLAPSTQTTEKGLVVPSSISASSSGVPGCLQNESTNQNSHIHQSGGLPLSVSSVSYSPSATGQSSSTYNKYPESHYSHLVNSQPLQPVYHQELKDVPYYVTDVQTSHNASSHFANLEKKQFDTERIHLSKKYGEQGNNYTKTDETLQQRRWSTEEYRLPDQHRSLHEWADDPPLSHVMMSETTDVESPTRPFSPSRPMSNDDDDFNLPWTAKTEFVNTEDNVTVDHGTELMDPSVAPESCPTEVQTHPTPVEGLAPRTYLEEQSRQQSMEFSPTDIFSAAQVPSSSITAALPNVSESQPNPASIVRSTVEPTMPNEQTQLYGKPLNLLQNFQNGTATSDQKYCVQQLRSAKSTSQPFTSPVRSDAPPPTAFKTPFTLSTPLTNGASEVNGRKQTKEMEFYSGLHPALRNLVAQKQLQKRSVLPRIYPPATLVQSDGNSSGDHLAPSLYTEWPPPAVTKLATPASHSSVPSVDHPGNQVHQQAQPTHSSGPTTRTPGHYIDVAVGLQGRVFGFDSQGQPVDLSVLLASAKSCASQGSSSVSVGTKIAEGLRGHQGPLIDLPMDQIGRLLDFYIDEGCRQLIESKGQNKNVLLWILLKRIGLSNKPPPAMDNMEVLAFLSDCAILSDFLGLIDDQLPKLAVDLPSCLPSSLPIRPPVSSVPQPSTAWADCCRQVCLGQAAEAVDFSIKFGMYAHALSLSLLISPQHFNAVRAEYAASLNSFGQPPKAQYWIKNAEGPPTPSGPFESLHIDCVKTLLFLHALPIAIHEQEVNETEKKFREMIQGVEDLSSTWLLRVRVNICYLGLEHLNCRLWLTALGKELINRNATVIGQCCLILSGLLDIGLLGSTIPCGFYLEVLRSPNVLVDFDWKHFQMTEFLERILSKWSSEVHLSSFDMLKFLYSRVLRMAGYPDMADRYLSHIKVVPKSILENAIKLEAPSVRPITPQKYDSNKLGHGFGISSLLRTLLLPDE